MSKNKIYDNIKLGFLEASPNLLICGVHNESEKSLNNVAIMSLSFGSDGTSDSKLALDIKPFGFPLVTDFVMTLSSNRIIFITDKELKKSKESTEIHKILKDNYYYKLTGNII